MAKPSGSIDKTCHRCGVNCAKLPRVRDDRGRYYCRPCYEAARRERDARHAARAALAKESEPEVTAEVVDEPATDVIPADEAMLFDDGDAVEASPASPPTSLCSGCGSPMAADAVVCTACGFNRTIGRKLEMATARPVGAGGAAKKGSAGAGIFAKPWFFGVASLVFFAVFFAVATQNQTLAMVYQGVAAAFSLIISIWILVLAFQDGAL